MTKLDELISRKIELKAELKELDVKIMAETRAVEARYKEGKKCTQE